MSKRASILDEVQMMGPVTVTQIAESCGYSESAVRYALGRLEREGLVTSDNYQVPARVYLATEEASDE